MAIAPTHGASADVEGQPLPLRRLAAAHGLRVGTAVAHDALVHDATYRGVLAREFDLVTPENVLKWETVHPQRSRFDFGPAERLAALARRNRMGMRGHALVWHAQNPAWLADALTSRRRALAVMRRHVRRVMRHLRDVVDHWDVVNEPMHPFGAGLRDSPWLRAIGPDYVELAFRTARRAAPSAKLYLNEVGLEAPGARFESTLAFVAELLARGVPIDGVGFQSHVVCPTVPCTALVELETNLARMAALGVDVAITELDVALPLPATSEAVVAQAAVYARAAAACLAVARCRAIVLWGFTDRYSWIEAALPGFGNALPLDSAYAAKPAYHALADLLRTPSRRGGPARFR